MADTSVTSLPVTAATSSVVEEMDIKPGWVALIVFMNLICISVNMAVIVSIVSDKVMRSQPSKWLVINCSISILIKALLLVSRIHHTRAGVPTWRDVNGLCGILEVIHLMKIYLTPVSIVQMTLERLVFLLQSNRGHSAFSQGWTLMYISAGWILALFFSLMCAFVMGDMAFTENSCSIYYSIASVNFFFSLFLICAFTCLTITISMIAIYFYKRMSPYNILDIIIFMGVSNGVYISYQIPTYLTYLSAWKMECLSCVNFKVLFNIYYSYLFVVPLCWLCSSRDIRTRFWQLCCKCVAKVKQLKHNSNAVVLENTEEERQV